MRTLRIASPRRCTLLPLAILMALADGCAASGPQDDLPTASFSGGKADESVQLDVRGSRLELTCPDGDCALELQLQGFVADPSGAGVLLAIGASADVVGLHGWARDDAASLAEAVEAGELADLEARVVSRQELRDGVVVTTQQSEARRFLLVRRLSDDGEGRLRVSARAVYDDEEELARAIELVPDSEGNFALEVEDAEGSALYTFHVEDELNLTANPYFGAAVHSEFHAPLEVFYVCDGTNERVAAERNLQLENGFLDRVQCPDTAADSADVYVRVEAPVDGRYVLRAHAGS